MTGESPGQRPGAGYELDMQALKGRYEGARGMRCRSILKLNQQPFALLTLSQNKLITLLRTKEKRP